MPWEEDPRYQKQQAAGVGLLLILLFINGLTVAEDTNARWQVVVYSVCFITAAAAFPSQPGY